MSSTLATLAFSHFTLISSTLYDIITSRMCVCVHICGCACVVFTTAIAERSTGRATVQSCRPDTARPSARHEICARYTCGCERGACLPPFIRRTQSERTVSPQLRFIAKRSVDRSITLLAHERDLALPALLNVEVHPNKAWGGGGGGGGVCVRPVVAGQKELIIIIFLKKHFDKCGQNELTVFESNSWCC